MRIASRERHREPFSRFYAISRFPNRGKPVGAGRRQPLLEKPSRQEPPPGTAEPPIDSSVRDSPLWKAGESLDVSGSAEGLERLLANNSLIVVR